MCLFGCTTQKGLGIRGQTELSAGTVVQQVRFDKSGEEHLWICYSEIKNRQIIGVSCQNDAAMPMFSGGLVDAEFRYHLLSRYLLPIAPELVTDWLRISLFAEFVFEDSRRAKKYRIVKSPQKTEITQLNNSFKAVIEPL